MQAEKLHRAGFKETERLLERAGIGRGTHVHTGLDGGADKAHVFGRGATRALARAGNDVVGAG